eukprot:TRINITY_DN5441_c0_g2_i1.p1 TRINITY_DN5441_c0_g2~~TRINITY_DN5441_c0_g2_i1.p1  ORF type:complete len:358 (+),score=96.83 TRINITY_DN5441_c0_g2_i1:88-1161(+)
MPLATTLYRLVEPGANLHWMEWVAVYGACVWCWWAAQSGAFGDAFLWNAGCQLALFAAVVQVPTFVTGHMSYVDIGWPVGVVVLGVNAVLYGGGSAARRWLVGSAVCVHGARMALGALVMFYPYRWKTDLSRYEYARTRWVAHTQAPALWWVKQQHDTLMQAYANSVTLAIPVLLTAANAAPDLHAVEVLGWAAWLAFWCLESVADGQKLAFVAAAKKNGDVRTAVLGHAPYDTAPYSLWTLCRHPNYFCEWMCWCAMTFMALPSAAAFAAAQDGLPLQLSVFAMLALAPRVFYDCLVYWTGAAPAEARSVQRRPAYKQHQARLNVLLPACLSLPCFDGHKVPGWPGAEGDDAGKSH